MKFHNIEIYDYTYSRAYLKLDGYVFVYEWIIRNIYNKTIVFITNI